MSSPGPGIYKCGVGMLTLGTSSLRSVATWEPAVARILTFLAASMDSLESSLSGSKEHEESEPPRIDC